MNIVASKDGDNGPHADQFIVKGTPVQGTEWVVMR